MQDQLQTAIAPYCKSVDYLEVRLEQSESTSISFQGPQLHAVDRSFGLAGGIRACHNGGWSFVTFNDLSELQDRVEQAISQAKLIGKETTQLAFVEPAIADVKVELGNDPRSISLDRKREIVEAYNQMLLEFDPRIQTTIQRFSIFHSGSSTCLLFAVWYIAEPIATKPRLTGGTQMVRYKPGRIF
nr:DNA gyrase modulator [Pseudanabaena sp. PCC 6802]